MVAKQAGIDLETIIPIKSTLRELASDYNLTVEQKADNEDVTAAKQDLMSQLQGMMTQSQGQPVEQPVEAPISPNAPTE